ncbi:MAG: DnaA ATPase domain-containing protein [Myxococcota bacterium]
MVRRLGADLPGFTLDAWIRPLVAEEREGDLHLSCPSAFHRERLRDRFLKQIVACASQEAGRPVRVEFHLTEASAGRAEVPSGIASSAGPPARPPRGAPKRPEVGAASAGRRPLQRTFPYTFDSFVVGPCNALAREAAFAVASGQQSNLNLLYLQAETGLGKTHLARAIVSEARERGHHRVLYTSAEAFTNDFTQSIRSKQMDCFKRRYRDSCDLLVVEDLPFLAAKGATQLELFHTLTHLLDAGGRVVLTGSCLPRSIAGLDPRLSSQMTAGFVAELERPTAQVRRKILRSKSAAGGVGLPQDCLDLLVERVRGNVRDLEGVLIQLVSTASLLKRSIDLDLTEAALRKLSDAFPAVRHLGCRQVMEVVARFFKTTPDHLASRSRRRDVLVPRQLAMFLCRRYTDDPVSVIASAFGRNHTAVANAEKVIARRILERAPLRYQFEALSERLDQLEREARQRPRTAHGVRHRAPAGSRRG